MPFSAKEFNKSKSHEPEIVDILKRWMRYEEEIPSAPRHLDMNNATDLVMPKWNCYATYRCRNYLDKYGSPLKYRDLTLYTTEYGKLEREKIRDTVKLKYYVYGWEGASGKIEDFIIVSLDNFRDSPLIEGGKVIPRSKYNKLSEGYSIVLLEKHNCVMVKKINGEVKAFPSILIKEKEKVGLINKPF